MEEMVLTGRQVSELFDALSLVDCLHLAAKAATDESSFSGLALMAGTIFDKLEEVVCPNEEEERAARSADAATRPALALVAVPGVDLDVFKDLDKGDILEAMLEQATIYEAARKEWLILNSLLAMRQQDGAA